MDTPAIRRNISPHSLVLSGEGGLNSLNAPFTKVGGAIISSTGQSQLRLLSHPPSSIPPHIHRISFLLFLQTLLSAFGILQRFLVNSHSLRNLQWYAMLPGLWLSRTCRTWVLVV